MTHTMQQPAKLLVPIRNFAVVDKTKCIYRSAQPMYLYEYRFLKEHLQVKTIVNLRSDLNHDERFAHFFGIEVITLPMRDHYPPTLAQAHKFMELVKSKHGVLFHCEHGRGRTSLFCVLARIAMGWTLDAALQEEVKTYGYQFQHPVQLEFLNQHFQNA